jgi:hypothetical protein
MKLFIMTKPVKPAVTPKPATPKVPLLPSKNHGHKSGGGRGNAAPKKK